jgi:hypothetical protein
MLAPPRNVVFVPYVRQGEVYVARIADRTIGWRDYADQSVKFERLEDGKITNGRFRGRRLER